MRSPRAVAIGLAVLAVLAVIVAVVASRGGNERADRLPSPGPTSPSASPSIAEPAFTAPLTGEPADEASLRGRPALAVKVENSVKARPQSGLELADVVYEELTEGGITRFIAMFHSHVPEVVGPIRSGRLVDAGVVPAYDGVLAISGARPDVLETIRRAGTPMLIDDGGPVFFREGSRSAPSNLYAAGEDLFAAAAELVADPPQPAWRFDPEPPEGHTRCPAAPAGATEAPPCADPGAALVVRMARVSLTGWEYDAPAGLYRRSQDGAPHTVTGTGRIGAANVLAIGTDVGAGPCCDPAGNPLTATRVSGQGSGVLLRDGRRYEITWSKAGPGSHFRLLGPDRRPIALKPGPTWVMLAPASGIPSVP